MLCGGYLLLAWVWLGAAGILYTARPQSRAVSSFVRWVVVAAVLLITLFDLHTTRRLVPITLPWPTPVCPPPPSRSVCAFRAHPDPAVVPRGCCGSCDSATASRRPAALRLLPPSQLPRHRRSGDRIRSSADHHPGPALRAGRGRRRVQLLVALLLLLPIHLLVGGMLVVAEHAAPYLYVVVIPTTVPGSAGHGHMPCCASICGTTGRSCASQVPAAFLTAVLGFVISLLGAVGFVGTRSLPESSAGAVCRHSGRWNRGTSATSR